MFSLKILVETLRTKRDTRKDLAAKVKDWIGLKRTRYIWSLLRKIIGKKQLGNAPLGTGSRAKRKTVPRQTRQTSFDKKSSRMLPWIDYRRNALSFFSFFVRIKKATSTLREPFRSFFHRKRSRFNALKSPKDGSFLDAIDHRRTKEKKWEEAINGEK